MTLDEVLKLLRGEPGTKVNITILRGEDIVFSLDIVREDIVVPTVRMDMIGDDIAYLRIIQFTPMTPEDVRKGLEGFSERGYRSIIIDLRGTPGGLLTSVTDIADFFIGGEVIVSTRSKIPSENKVFRASDKIIVPRENPVLVLIDKGSASASEILAGAIKDNNRGFLVGEKTFGKGSVQQVRSIGESGFKLTMSRYYTPSGVNIDKVGILPDVEVREEEMSDEEAESYKVIIEKFMIQEFARENPNPSDSDISSFIARLEKEGLTFSERLIRRLIRNELNKNNNDPPVYDLEFDIVLQKAVEMIKTGEFPAR
jgi:carboxyl-terminal processing protease